MNSWNTPHEFCGDNFFNCKSIFTPYVEEVVEPSGINDPVPYEEQLKESNKIKYLPGEKLLIKLGRESKKNKKKKAKKNNIDIDRLSDSLSRVLTKF